MNANVPAVTLTEADLRNLQRSRSWARFLAVVGFVMTALLVLGGLGVGVATRALPGAAAGGLSTWMAIVMGVGAIGAGLYAVITWRYASAVRDIDRRQGAALVDAFRNLRFLWTFNAVIYVLTVLYTVVSIVGTWFGFMPRPPGG
jgi:hypothetical protein